LNIGKYHFESSKKEGQLSCSPENAVRMPKGDRGFINPNENRILRKLLRFSLSIFNFMIL
jgi:hypothetical protein